MTPLAATPPAEEVRSAASGQLELFGDYALGDPAFLFLLPVALGALAWGRSRRGRASARVPRVPAAFLGGRAPRSLRQRLAWLPTLGSGLALALVVVSLARPLRQDLLRTSTSEGVDIVLAIDRSSSMKYPDLDSPDLSGGRSRLEVVKEVVGDFAERRMTDREGAADACALLAFARYPQLLCPFTLDANALLGLLDEVELVRYQAEDGTGIGVALAKAVAILRGSESESRVVVLLTDGQTTVWDITPEEAGELAAEEGVRVYCVFAGRYVFVEDRFGNVRATDRELETSDLEAVAERTGGRFFRARDEAELEEVYREIERLERTPREERRVVESYDLYPWFLSPAIVLYALAWIARATWARRLSE